MNFTIINIRPMILPETCKFSSVSTLNWMKPLINVELPHKSNHVSFLTATKVVLIQTLCEWSGKKEALLWGLLVALEENPLLCLLQYQRMGGICHHSLSTKVYLSRLDGFPAVHILASYILHQATGGWKSPSFLNGFVIVLCLMFRIWEIAKIAQIKKQFCCMMVIQAT